MASVMEQPSKFYSAVNPPSLRPLVCYEQISKGKLVFFTSRTFHSPPLSIDECTHLLQLPVFLSLQFKNDNHETCN